MFNSFHHFRPAEAKTVLRDAAEAGQPIGIFEIPERAEWRSFGSPPWVSRGARAPRPRLCGHARTDLQRSLPDQ